MLKQGDIVLIPIPFTDLSAQKQRPVIVISNSAYHQQTPDMVVVAMTSNLTHAPYSFVITSKDLQKGMLKRDSLVRVDRIYTLSQDLVRQTFGNVKPHVLKNIQNIVHDLIEDTPQPPP